MADAINIIVVFTCYERKEKTEKCIRSLASGNRLCQFTFVVVDDNSSDGTVEMLRELKKTYNIHILNGNGKLYYSGGMRLGMQYVLQKCKKVYDYVLLINDDVNFFDDSIEKMISQSREQNNAVIAGAMCDNTGALSYSAVKYTKGIKCRNMKPAEWNISADTFCANGVLIPYCAFEKTGVMDPVYVHAMGDFDYGMMLVRNGFSIYVSKEFVGQCNDNPKANTWSDTSLRRCERIRRKESPKGLPAKQWFYFLKKNFGLVAAIKGEITPYIRILIGK